MSGTSSLLIIAHNPILRDGIAELLNGQSDLTAIATIPEWAAVQASFSRQDRSSSSSTHAWAPRTADNSLK